MDYILIGKNEEQYRNQQHPSSASSSVLPLVLVLQVATPSD